MMLRLLLFLSFFGLIFFGFSQNVKFRSSDQKLLVSKGDLVEISADSAYIISSSRALLLNEKLEELSTARKLNAELKFVNGELLDKVKEVEKLVSKILKKMDSDSDVVEEGFDDILLELDMSLNVMKENNRELATNNSNLKQQIAAMDDTISKLKKEIRGIWWNGLVDKIVVGALGVGVGFLLGAL